MTSVCRYVFLFVCLFISSLDKISGKRINTQGKVLENRIIGGEETTIGQYPYLAAINVQTGDSRFFCGGAIVNELWVITSGHCVYNAVLFTIRLGSHLLEGEDPNRVTVATSEYVTHPDFNPDTIEHDIALIRLRMPITYTHYIGPSYLPIENVLSGTYVNSIGWGQTSDFDSQLSNTLRYVTLSALSNEECRIVYGNQITDNMICAGGSYNQGTCIGDNGSPLLQIYYRYYLVVGIASFVSGNGCESTDPSGYTRMYPYVNWISNTSVITTNT